MILSMPRTRSGVSLLHRLSTIALFWGCLLPASHGQVVEVQPVFPKVGDDVTIIFDATEGNGALMGVSPVYAHAGLITSESVNGNDWKHVIGNWGTADPRVLMTSLGNNRHALSYNIKEFYGVEDGEIVESLAFVFRNTNGSIVGRASDGADIFYPVYPDDVAFLSVLLAPQSQSLALFDGEVLPIKGATSQDADLYLYDNDDLLYSTTGNLLNYNLTVTEAGNHDVRFVAIRGTDTLEQSFYYTMIVDVVVEDPPAGREDGLTIINDSTVYFQLYAPGKAFVHLLGDMSNWDLRSDFQMKKSMDGNRWWYEVTGLEPGGQYQYQYVVDGTIRIGDPYSTLILDPFNDPAIDEITYPHKPEYPYGLTTGQVTSFVLGPVATTAPLSPKPAKADLVIYELLIRDFLQAHSFDALRDTLDYLQRLGVNAIELMPVQEFEGNIGWGYNPSYHMALDKYYGTSDALHAFIEACHARGMAVILDVVYNHAFGQSPLVQMYWDAAQNRPAANSPWFNQVARHDFNVGYDFNHESAATKYFVKRVMSWWMETYGVDGFRFDLSKGFTQKNTLGNIGAWGAYDPSRIDIWQEYADHVWSMDPEAYVILEHFANNDEEIELSSRGMMLWGNMHGTFTQASTGFGGSDFSGTWHAHRGWSVPHLIGFMESHDEERIMYRNLIAGNSNTGYNIKEFNTALGRIELVNVFMYMIPGPKMIWEFGELGYDYSINYCPDGTINNNCRLEPKPIRWDYKDVYRRQRIYDIIRAMILLRQHPAVKSGTLEISLSNQFEKIIRSRHSDMDVVVAGNFYTLDRNIAPIFTRTGWWYDYLSGDSLQVNDVNMTISVTPGDYHVYTTQRLTPGFDITSSLRDIIFSEQPLEIRPTINEGQFTILFPEPVPGASKLWVSDVNGRRADSSMIWLDGSVEVTIDDPASGVYFVCWIAGQTLFTGKVIIP